MRQNLLETYAKQLRVAEAYVNKNFEGRTVSNNTKLTTAVLLDNTNRWITEAMNTSATERSDLGDWKKFCLNLTNIAVPSLIANDLVIVHPMTSYSGSVAYLEYVSKTDKGDVQKGDVFNSVFKLGKLGDARTAFTSQVIVETVGAGAFTPGLTPADVCADRGELKMTAPKRGFRDANGNYHAAKLTKADGTVAFADVASSTIGAFKVYAAGDTTGVAATAEEGDKIAYFSDDFQMERVPATDIPTIGPRMKRIALVAEPRRIAVRYDQITAFQAKTDYGFSLDKQIAEQACGELEMLADAAKYTYEDGNRVGTKKGVLTWSKVLPVGVSKFEHYNGFLEVIEQAKAVIYKRTKKFHPNFMVINVDVLPVLKFVNGFTAVKNAKMNGPYKVGDLDGMNVYVSPALESGEFFLGLNGSDMMSAAGVYAPYMAIVPTQLLGTPDGGLAQGFSTWYAKAILNDNLLVAGKITDIEDFGEVYEAY